jgi:transposase
MPFVLNPDEKQKLEVVFKKEKDWRVRERAETLLLLSQGLSCEEVADRQGLCAATVRSTRGNWRNEGFASLTDKPRCGAPHKLSEPEVQRLVQWASTEPLTAAALLARHNEAQGRGVHLNTLVSELKRHGFVWKRSRHSLKKSVTPSPSSKPGAT